MWLMIDLFLRCCFLGLKKLPFLMKLSQLTIITWSNSSNAIFKVFFWHKISLFTYDTNPFFYLTSCIVQEGLGIFHKERWTLALTFFFTENCVISMNIARSWLSGLRQFSMQIIDCNQSNLYKHIWAKMQQESFELWVPKYHSELLLHTQFSHN